MKGIALLAALSLAGPASAQAPGIYEQAVSARMSGDPAQAIAMLEPLVRDQPANADAWLQLGYGYLALGRLDEAERAFGQVLAIAPSYRDASDGLDLIARRRESSAPRYRLDADGAYSLVGRSQPDWRGAAVQLRAEAGHGLALTGRVEAAQRFGLSDVYVEGRADARSGRASGFVAIGGTPDADFRPEVQAGAGGSVTAVTGKNPTVASVETRWARFPAGDVWTLAPAIEQYLLGGRAWITARSINVFDSGRHSSGWLARADVQASTALRLFGGAADAPDLSEGRVIDTLSLFGGAAVDLDDRRSVRMSIARDRPDGGATRTQFALGLSVRY